MKKLLLSLSLLALGSVSWANPVTQGQAQQAARKFFSSHGITMASKAKAFRAPHAATSGTAAWYVFNAGNGNGFAIISGDDRTTPVLGYALSGSLSEDSLPDNLRSFLETYAEQIEYIQKNNITVNNTPPSTERNHIEPMLTTKWNQSAPYNNACPMYSGERSVTGCVATAMAQVLYYQYQQHPSTIATALQATIPSYRTGRGTTVPSISAGSAIDWGNMLPTYSYEGSETSDQKTAVANLMYYCGAAVEMNYSNSSSSASSSDVAPALTKYFGFDASTRLVDRDDSYSTKEWNDLVYNELENNRVVFYSGVSSAGSGHAFVINGYDANNFFYVNWGWSGRGDGSYLLSILSPVGTGIGAGTVSDGYNLQQDMIINAEPDHGGSSSISATVVNFTQSGNNLSFTLMNTGTETVSFNYSFASVASDGSLTPIGTMATTPSALEQNTYYPSVLARLNLSTLANGTYTIVPAAKLTSSSTWESLWVGHTINVTVSNGTVTFNNEDDTPSLSASALAADGAYKAGRTMTVTATLTNSGSGDFEGQLYLFASTSSSKGSAVATPSAGVMAGSNANMSVTWTPLASGTYTLWLCSDSRGSNVLATLSNVVIAEGNGLYAFTLKSMTVDGEEEDYTTDSEGRTVRNVSGSDLIGSYTMTTNQRISSSARYTTFIMRYNDETGEYEMYDDKITGRYSYYGYTLPVNNDISWDFSFTDLPDGKYIIRPEVGSSIGYSTHYYMSSELWYDDSHVYVIGGSTGIASVRKAAKADVVTVYNMQGMKVGTIESGRLSSLPHGMYIVNGRKIAVK